MASSEQLRRQVRELAGLYRVQASYTSADGRRKSAAPRSLLAVLSSLGAPVERLEDVPDALRARRVELQRRIVEPVTVAWGGRPRAPGLTVRLPVEATEKPVRLRLALEGDAEREVTAEWRRSAPLGEGRRVEGVRFVEIHLAPRVRLPEGYHRVVVEAGRHRASTLLISAPMRHDDGRPPSWGVFLPLYALRSDRDWGVGDLTDLLRLLGWVRGLGGSVVATLPLLASFLGEGDEPFEASPYSPASRLFWNELFLDVEGIPEAAASREARRLLRSPSLRRERRAMREEPLVDYRRAMVAKRRVLEAMSRHLFADRGGPRGRELRRWTRQHPEASDYAAFRAATERRGSWRRWPDRERNGFLPRHGGDPEAFRYHLYVQWLMAGQMERVSRRAREIGTGLYFDFPLGVNPDGYDVWRERESFALRASAGSPPDPFFTAGQDWGFPPLHPDRIRDEGYRYVIGCLRHLLRHAGVLRIDHVMGLHRLYWIPQDMEARNGAYVRYRPEELYAILALEASRSETIVVGEDLGTVPAVVPKAMRRHRIYRSFVLQYEARDDPRAALPVPPAESLASVNTHDMPPFASFWRGLETAIRLQQGWMDEAGAKQELALRGDLRRAIVAFLHEKGWLSGPACHMDPEHRRTERAVLQALLDYLAASPARFVVVTLEDLWGETEPQNVPGTVDRYPNWRRKAGVPFEGFVTLPRVTGALRRVDHLRRRPGQGRTAAVAQ